MAGTAAETFGKLSLCQIPIPSTSLSFTLMLLVLGIIFFPLTIPSEVSPLNLANTTTPHSSHPHRHRPGGKSHSTTSDMPTISIGQRCDRNTKCANFSTCQDKILEDQSMGKVCQCDPFHMNHVKGSCFVKPGHQCYFPELQQLYKCGPEAECRTGLNRSHPEAGKSGYCFCKDKKDDEPFRIFNVDAEIYRCGAGTGLIYFGVIVSLSIFIGLV